MTLRQSGGLANIYPGGVYEIPQGLKKKTLNDQGILEGKSLEVPSEV